MHAFEDCQVTIPKQACYIITKEAVKICDKTANKVALTPQEPTQKLDLAYNLMSGKCQACNEGLACTTLLEVLCGTCTVSFVHTCWTGHCHNVSVDRVLQSIQWAALLKVKWQRCTKELTVQGHSMNIQLRVSGIYHRSMTKPHYQLGLCQQYFRSLWRLHSKQHSQNDYISPHLRRPWSQSQTTHDVVFLTPLSANNNIILGYFIGQLWIATSCRLDYSTNVEHSHNRERFSSGKCQMTVVR